MRPFSSSKPVQCFPPSRPKSSTFFKRETFSRKTEATESQLPHFCVLNMPGLQLTGCFPQNEPDPKVLNWPTRGGRWRCIWRKLKSVNCQAVLNLHPSNHFTCTSISGFFFPIFDHNHHLLLQHMGACLNPTPKSIKKRTNNKERLKIKDPRSEQVFPWISLVPGGLQSASKGAAWKCDGFGKGARRAKWLHFNRETRMQQRKQ